MPLLIQDYSYSDCIFNYHRIRVITAAETNETYFLVSDLTSLLNINFDSILIDNLNLLLAEDAEKKLVVLCVENVLANAICLSEIELIFQFSKSAIIPHFRRWLHEELFPKYQPHIQIINLPAPIIEADGNAVNLFFAVYQKLLTDYSLVLNHAPLFVSTDIVAINLPNIYQLAKRHSLLLPPMKELKAALSTSKQYQLIAVSALVESPIWHKPVNCCLFKI